MFKFLAQILFDESAATLAITTKSSNTLITASGFNTNWSQIEAVVNALEADNISADAVTAAKLNADVVRSGFGLVQHTDGSLYVDLADTNPGLEVNADGGLRIKAYGIAQRTANGLEVGRTADMLLSAHASAPDGYTDVSSTYANKFIRISATALSAGGADTHTHGAGSYTVPAHDHGGATGGVSFGGGGTQTAGALDTTHTHPISTQAAAAITGTSASGDNVPVFVTLKMYQKS